MKILEEPHQDPQRSLRRSLKILKDLKKIFTRDFSKTYSVLSVLLEFKDCNQSSPIIVEQSQDCNCQLQKR